MSLSERYDLLVVGSGPGGQKAAIQGAKLGAKVVIVERERRVGGHGLSHGALPSKTLRETTLALSLFRARCAGALGVELPQSMTFQSLMSGVEGVVEAHAGCVADQLERNGVPVLIGQARFASPHTVEVETVRGERWSLHGEHIVIATGARPSHPPSVPVDHEHVLDANSVTTLTYLPRSMIILGAGMIGAEYACIFSELGVDVTLIDDRERPLEGFDQDLTDGFEQAFRRRGGRYMPHARPQNIWLDGLEVNVELDSGVTLRAEKVLSALARTPNLDALGLERAGLGLSPRKRLPRDMRLRSEVPHIYIVGDAAGPPYLVGRAMEEGRRAALDALGLDAPRCIEAAPAGVCTIPEMAMVGLTEEAARAEHGSVMVGLSRYCEIARGHVAGVTQGLLKLVADARGERILGVHILGDGATELIHVGQMALVSGIPVASFIENTFNYPTFAEAYRVAALDIVGQRTKAGLDAA